MISKKDYAETPCHVITTNDKDGRQRCVLCPPDHKGPHWEYAKPVPDGCTCEFVCLCREAS